MNESELLAIIAAIIRESKGTGVMDMKEAFTEAVEYINASKYVVTQK